MPSDISAICWGRISAYILKDFQFIQINSITGTLQRLTTNLSLIFLGTFPCNAGKILKHLLLENGIEVPVQNELRFGRKWDGN